GERRRARVAAGEAAVLLGNLPAGLPEARDRGVALGARAAVRDPERADLVAPALDQRLAALPAARVLELADAPGDVARVDVAEALLAADLARAQEVGDRRVGVLGHLVVLVEGRDV